MTTTKTKPDLNIDFCSRDAARYAVMHWHYSKAMPSGKLVTFGVWENSKFIGAVMFGRGANNHIGCPYALEPTQVCELVRVALNTHQTPVTRIIKICIAKLKKLCPGLRLIVSYADAGHNHKGGIYQAGNWIYEGPIKGNDDGMYVNGKLTHKRSLVAKYGTSKFEVLTQKYKLNVETKKIPTKFKYIMPLDVEMRKQILPLAKPYPTETDLNHAIEKAQS